MKNQEMRAVKFGGRVLGTITHTGKRRFEYSMLMDPSFGTRRQHYSSWSLAEKAMCKEYLASVLQQGYANGYESMRVESLRTIAEAEAERDVAKETSQEAGIAALATMSLQDIAEAFVALYGAKSMRGEHNAKDDACQLIWNACENHLEGCIGLPKLREMVVSAEVSDVLNDPMFDAYREEVRHSLRKESEEHPALVELRWAARSRSDSERSACVEKALGELRRSGDIW